VHQIRNSLRYVASKNHKAFMVDLKRVYRAASLGEAEAALDELETVRGENYPVVIKSWRTKWQHLSAYSKYPHDIRRIIYTTNSIEAVHLQFRKLTKTKGGFPNNDSLLKLLYMGIQNASKKWTMPIQNWNLTISQLSIFFEGRLDAALKL
jgi:transposase-like protein